MRQWEVPVGADYALLKFNADKGTGADKSAVGTINRPLRDRPVGADLSARHAPYPSVFLKPIIGPPVGDHLWPDYFVKLHHRPPRTHP